MHGGNELLHVIRNQHVLALSLDEPSWLKPNNKLSGGFVLDDFFDTGTVFFWQLINHCFPKRPLQDVRNAEIVIDKAAGIVGVNPS